MNTVPPTLAPVHAGVLQDLQVLLIHFEDTNSFRLEDFSRIFREMDFADILNGRYNDQEYIEFMENLLQVCASFMSVRNNYGDERKEVERIFGLYATYALYFLQPKDIVYQIMITPQLANEIYSLERLFIEDRHLDAVACLHTLIDNHAFNISASDASYDPTASKRLNLFDLETDYIAKHEVPFEECKKALEDDVFSEMALLHNVYMKGKQNLGVKANLMKKDPVEELQSILENGERKLEEWKKLRAGEEKRTAMEKSVNRESSGEPDDVELAEAGPSTSKVKVSKRPIIPVAQPAGLSRDLIRTKAYSTKTKHSRTRRYLDPEMDANFPQFSVAAIAQQISEEDQKLTISLLPSSSQEQAELAVVKNEKIPIVKKRSNRKKTATAVEEVDPETLAAELIAGAGVIPKAKPEANVAKTPRRSTAARVTAPKRKKDVQCVESPTKKPAINETGPDNLMTDDNLIAMPKREEKLLPTKRNTKTPGKRKKDVDKTLEHSAKEKAADKKLEMLRASFKSSMD